MAKTKEQSFDLWQKVVELFKIGAKTLKISTSLMEVLWVSLEEGMCLYSQPTVSRMVQFKWPKNYADPLKEFQEKRRKKTFIQKLIQVSNILS